MTDFSKPIPMTYHGVDSRGDYVYYCPECCKGGSYMGTGQVHCYDHLPPKEDKMRKYEEAIKLLSDIMQDNLTKEIQEEFKIKWFK